MYVAAQNCVIAYDLEVFKLKIITHDYKKQFRHDSAVKNILQQVQDTIHFDLRTLLCTRIRAIIRFCITKPSYKEMCIPYPVKKEQKSLKSLQRSSIKYFMRTVVN